jgi:HlyD family secretion protein
MLLLGGCSQAKQSPGPAPRTAKLERRDITRECREDGVVLAGRSVDILPPNAERLLEMRVREGDRVKKGDVLARFDASRFDADIRVLEAKLAAARLKLDGLQRQREKADVLQAKQNLIAAKQASDEGQRFYDVQKELTRVGLASSNDFTKAEAQCEMARLQASLAQALVDEVTERPKSPQIAELEAGLAEAERLLNDAKEDRDRCTVTAPFDGVLTMVDETVKQANAPLTDITLRLDPRRGALLSIADSATVRIVVNFFESDVSDLQAGQSAIVTASHAPGKTFSGVVTQLGQIGRVRGRAGLLPVEVEVKNEGLLLRPGLTAQVRIIVSEKKNVPSLPVEFIAYEGEAAVVHIAAGGRKAKVTTGLSNADYVEILGGLQEADTVILEPEK